MSFTHPSSLVYVFRSLTMAGLDFYSASLLTGVFVDPVLKFQGHILLTISRVGALSHILWGHFLLIFPQMRGFLWP